MPTFRYKKCYEWTNQFFKDDLRRLPRTKPKVFEKFGRYSGLSGKELKLAFRSGYIPLVEIRPLRMYGYTPPIGDRIQLGKIFIDEMEAALEWRGPRNPNRYTPTILESDLMLILEATVLHEMVHFFRRKFNEQAQLNMASSRGRGYEEAVARRFEKDAYGKYCTVHNLSLNKRMPKTAALASK